MTSCSWPSTSHSSSRTSRRRPSGRWSPPPSAGPAGRALVRRGPAPTTTCPASRPDGVRATSGRLRLALLVLCTRAPRSRITATKIRHGGCGNSLDEGLLDRMTSNIPGRFRRATAPARRWSRPPGSGAAFTRPHVRPWPAFWLFIRPGCGGPGPDPSSVLSLSRRLLEIRHQHSDPAWRPMRRSPHLLAAVGVSHSPSGRRRQFPSLMVNDRRWPWAMPAFSTFEPQGPAPAPGRILHSDDGRA